MKENRKCLNGSSVLLNQSLILAAIHALHALRFPQLLTQQNRPALSVRMPKSLEKVVIKLTLFLMVELLIEKPCSKKLVEMEELIC